MKYHRAWLIKDKKNKFNKYKIFVKANFNIAENNMLILLFLRGLLLDFYQIFLSFSKKYFYANKKLYKPF